MQPTELNQEKIETRAMAKYLRFLAEGPLPEDVCYNPRNLFFDMNMLDRVMFFRVIHKLNRG